MDDFRLRVFIAAARTLSFTKAAEELFISQPAVSKHVCALESAYGVTLFNRRGSRLELTPAGEVLLGCAERLEAEYRRMQYEMSRCTERLEGELRLGASTTVAQYLLPPILARFTTRYPDLRVTVASQAMFRPFFAGLEVGWLDVDVRGRHHSLRGMWKLAAEARRLGVDAVADVHDVLRSQAFDLAMRLHGIRVARIRKGRAEKRRFIRCGGRGMAPLRHTVLRYCDVFRHLGFVFDDPAPVVHTAHPNPFGEKHGVWVGFAPFSAHRGKTCPEPQRREVVRLLAARCERLFIHSGGGAEAAFAEEMERTYPNVTALWGKVRFAGEIDLIANLDCVVTMDSLVMHLAALVGAPCVSLWGATHPGLGFLGYGAPEEGVLQADLPCRPCSVFGARPCRLGDYRCLTALTPERVVERVERLIARPKP